MHFGFILLLYVRSFQVIVSWVQMQTYKINFNLYFCCSEPRYALSLLPLPLFGISRSFGVDAHTVLLSVLPLTLIPASVWPMESSMTFFVVVYVVSLIHTSVRPGENAVTLHFVVLPQALVLASIRPIVHTLPNEKVSTR